MSQYGVYTYPYNQQASLGNFNMPLSNKKLVIYKGANNPVSFTVLNADGKYTILNENEVLMFSIFDSRNQQKIFEVQLDATNPSWVSEAGVSRPSISNNTAPTKVYYTGLIPAGVIADLSTGTKYRWSIRRVQTDSPSLVPVTQYLYTGLNYEASSDLEISSLAAPEFISSTVLSAANNTSFNSLDNPYTKPIAKGYVGDFDVLGTSPVPSAVQYGFVDGMSTIAFYLNNFIGRIQLQGSLSNDVPTDMEDYKWFIIKLNGCEYIENPRDPITGESTPLTGIAPFNYKGQFMWVRVVVCIPPKYVVIDPIVTTKQYVPFDTLTKIVIRK